MHTKPKSFKQNILLIQARLDLGLSQRDLARQLQVSPRTVRRWEQGLACPHPHYRRLLCSLFQRTAADLSLDPHASLPELELVSTQPFLSHSEQALSPLQTTNPVEEIATMLVAWGEILLQRRQFENAEVTFREVLQTASCEHQPLYALASYGLARAAAGRGDEHEAHKRGKEALQVFDALHHMKTPEVRIWLSTLHSFSSPQSSADSDDDEEQGIK